MNPRNTANFSFPLTLMLLVTTLLAAPVPVSPQTSEPRHPAALELRQGGPASNRWLRDAESDAERFRRIEINSRGFSQAMEEVGRRFLEVHDAVLHGNYELATYYWEKIYDAINAGLMRRPARTANAEGMFLNRAWRRTHEALQTGDRERIEDSLRDARRACMACHEAEGVAHMNGTRALRESAP